VIRRWNAEKYDMERYADRNGVISRPVAASYGMVWRCRLTVSKPVSKARLVSALETVKRWKMLSTVAFECNLRRYSMVIYHYVRNERMIDARRVLSQMQWDKVAPSIDIFNMLLRGRGLHSSTSQLNLSRF
jgi:pentatricopeptide repeat domain-containing protein 1